MLNQSSTQLNQLEDQHILIHRHAPAVSLPALHPLIYPQPSPPLLLFS
jgi:hypothetical protein